MMENTILDLSTSSDDRKPERKKRKQSDPEVLAKKQFQTYRSTNSWIKDDEKAFLATGNLYCLLCKKDFSVATFTFDENGDISLFKNSFGNVGTHCKTKVHYDHMTASKKKSIAGRITSHFPLIGNEQDTDDFAGEVKTLRTLVNSYLISLGLNPHLIGQIFADSQTLSEAMGILRRNGDSNFGTESKVNADVQSGLAIVKAYIARELRDEPLSLVSDSASLKHDSAIAVLASCSKLPSPMLLTLITPNEKSNNDEDDVYNYELAAVDIKKVAESYGIIIANQVTFMMGDNVAYNKCIAEELQITQGKCLPHALALIVKHGYDKLPNGVAHRIWSYYFSWRLK